LNRHRALCADRPRLDLGFQRRVLGFRFLHPRKHYRPTLPRNLRSGFMRARLLTPSKCLRLSSRSPLVRATTPAGVLSLFAASPTASTPPSLVWGPPCGGAGDPNLPLRSAHRFSQPRGGLLRRRFRGLVSSRSHVQGSFSPSKGFSRSAAVPDSSPGPAPVPLVRARSPATRLPRARPSTSRPRPAERCVRPGRGLAFPSVAPLVGFLLLRALAPPPSARLPVAGPSARDDCLRGLLPAPFRERGLDPIGSPSACCRWPRWRRPSPRRRPVRGFEPSVRPLAR
jgi:hypothetical protein